MILIVDHEYRRLCKDGKWRGFAHFGDYSSCVKVYRYLEAAKKRAKKIGGRVVELFDALEVDASGCVFETFPSNKPGYENVRRWTLADFIVED